MPTEFGSLKDLAGSDQAKAVGRNAAAAITTFWQGTQCLPRRLRWYLAKEMAAVLFQSDDPDEAEDEAVDA